MNCPKCEGPMWDNRVDKKNPKGPDWKCKDKSCAHAVWEKPKSAKSEAGPGKPTPPTEQPDPSDDRDTRLAALYAKCFNDVTDLLRPHMDASDPVFVFTGQDIIAAVATNFIARSKLIVSGY